MHTNMHANLFIHTYQTHTHTHTQTHSMYTHITCTHTADTARTHVDASNTSTKFLFTCAIHVRMVYKYCAHYTHNNTQNLLVISLVFRYSSEVMGEQAVSLLEVVIVVDY